MAAMRPLALLLAAHVHVIGSTCTSQDGACICEAEGQTWDLSELDGDEVVATGDVTGCAAGVAP